MSTETITTDIKIDDMEGKITLTLKKKEENIEEGASSKEQYIQMNKERALKRYYRERYGKKADEMLKLNQAKKQLRRMGIKQPLTKDRLEKVNFYSKRCYYRKTYGIEQGDAMMALNNMKKHMSNKKKIDLKNY